MKLRRLIILLLFVSIIISCNVVSASELTSDENNAQSDANLLEINTNNEITEQICDDSLGESSDFQTTASDEYTVWVGTNSTPNGKGTKEDPFANLELARDDVNKGEAKSKVTVNIDDGTYVIGSHLKFNTSNLNINGTGNNVILINQYKNTHAKQSFGFIPSTSGNFTMSNIIFNVSNYHIDQADNCYGYRWFDGWFTPFVNEGFDDLITFNNCKFVGYDNKVVPDWEEIYDDYSITILPPAAFNDNDKFVFNYCKFGRSSGEVGAYDIGKVGNVTFNYCAFSEFFGDSGLGLYESRNTIYVSFDSCWLGHNNGYTKTFFNMLEYRDWDEENRFEDRGLGNAAVGNRHAILEVSENYLGDNTYEIVGELKWNDKTIDNIDKLCPMTVYLSADKGIIPKTATLENGTFKVNYTSDSDYHQITVVLDNQTIKLNNKINFILDVPQSIEYGSDFNVIVSFPTNVKGDVYVTVDNETYGPNYVDDKNNTIITINDKLPKGVHKIDVKFASDKNEFNVIEHEDDSLWGYHYTVEESDSFGFNNISISVLGTTSSLTAPAVTTSYNVTKELIVTLTDVDGNVLVNKPVNVVVGTINMTLNTTSDGQVRVDVSSLVPDSYVANIAFAGDGQYYESNTTANVVVNKVVPNINISHGALVPGEKLTIEVEIPYATENVAIIVNGDKNTTKLVDNIATYTIDELAQGTYYVTVLYAGDELCDFVYKTDYSFDVVKSTADLINELNQTVADKDAKIGELNQTVADKDAKIGELNQTVADKDAKIGELNQTVADKDAKIGELNQTVADKDAKIGELNQTVADKDAKIGELNQTVADKDAKIGELNQTVADKDAKIGELNQTVADKDAKIGELNQTVADKDAKIGELNQTVADKDAKIGELNQTVADKDAKIGELNQTVADKDAKIGELNQTVADKDAKIGELNQTVADKDAKIGELNQTVADKDAKIGELNQTVADKDAKIGELNQTVADKDAKIGELNQTVADKDAKIGELNQTVADKDAKIGELNQTVADKDAKIGELNQTVADKDAKIGELNQTVADKDAKIGELNQTVADKDAKIGELNQTLADKDAKIGELNQTVADKDAKIGELNQTVADKDAKIGELNQTVVEQNKTINKASNPVATNILVKDITTTATTTKYLTISLVDANNVPLVNKTVKFTVNGKTDSVVTNGSGVATVKVSYSTAGTRYYTFSFLGETGYSASIASAKVVVSKKATKLTAPKKTFKATTKTKKVQVKLTAGKTVLKNKKVTLKVKGKTYTAKTNKKGIATFKITKLTKKGTFKYNVKFAGDKAYKAVNKNGKITIK